MPPKNTASISPKLFTLDAANALLPFVEEQLNHIHSSHAELEECRDELNVLSLMSQSGADNSSPEQQRLQYLNAHAEELVQVITRAQRALHEAGCVPKSLKDGLIDFFALRGDRLVFLCWQRGEAQIEFWHTLEGGYQARHSIDTFATGADLGSG